MSDYGGRRFLLVIVCGLAYTMLLVGGYLDSGAYVALQIATVAAYISGNTYQKHSENKYGNSNSNQRAD
ncbi:hypothetical protein LCGC14_2938240 [marine sediment metagenome]|uniref:Uncharacterized protein n=1 Tax=marine sediment metagenome TaxID=412755 RepID=A0A0F8XIT8_9ZZZZ